MLKSKGQELHIDIQLAKLSMLEPRAQLVIQIHWLANIATFKGLNGRSVTSKLPSSLLVFYFHNRNLPLPTVTFGRKTERRKPNARIDKKIENQPFLSSISAYRYRHTD